MPKAIKRCKVCGSEYEACHSLARNVGVFRWQEVACSPECGAIYLRQINESRGIVEDNAETPVKTQKKSKRKQSFSDDLAPVKKNTVEPEYPETTF